MKKLMCLLLSVILLVSVFSVSVCAEAETSKTDAVLHFDANSVKEFWYPFSDISCHIWECGGDAFYRWGSKDQLCSDEDGDGIYTYNLTEHGITLKDNTLYACIFYSNQGTQCYHLLFDTTVLGDTAYGTNEYYEGMEDSVNNFRYYAYWRNQNPKEYGPELEIDPIGRVQGTCIPPTRTAIDMFDSALVNSFENARTYSGRSDQQIIDYLAYHLGLSSEQVEQAIINSGEKIEWKKELSTADKIVGDADLDGEVSILDATAIGMYLALLTEFSSEQEQLADIDFSASVSILDATAVQKSLQAI